MVLASVGEGCAWLLLLGLKVDLRDAKVALSAHLPLISSPTVVKTTDRQQLRSYAPPETLHSKTDKQAKRSKALKFRLVEGSVPAEGPGMLVRLGALNWPQLR